MFHQPKVELQEIIKNLERECHTPNPKGFKV